MLDLTVIITTYNDAKYLENAINSLLKQTKLPKEIIIVDDGSQDDLSKEIYEKKFKCIKETNIRYYKKTNGGPSSARNYGINKASSEYIIFLDVDDSMPNYSLEYRHSEIIKLDKSYGSFYGSAMFEYKNSKSLDLVEDNNGLINTSNIGRKNKIPGSVHYYIFRKDVLDEIKGFNEDLKFNEDFEILARILKKYKVKGINRVVYYRNSRDNSWSKSNPIKAYLGVEDFLNLAEKNELMDLEEITIRRKENRLSYVKKQILKEKSLKHLKNIVDEAFSIKKPKNIKEKILYLIFLFQRKNKIEKN